MMKDTKFWLTTFFEEQEQTKHEYKSFKRKIENNGCFIVKVATTTVKIYTPELVVIFTSKELPARNMDTQIETTINGWDYINTYIEAYKEGEQYFENEFKISANTLYGVNAEQYVRDIHLNFFHVQHTGINDGWGYVKKQYPFILTHKAVKEFGYYSGIVNKVEEQVKKHPRLFASFDKCEHDLPPQQTKTKTDQLKAPIIALFCSVLNDAGIIRKLETESVQTYCKRVCNVFEFTYKIRIGKAFYNSDNKANKDKIKNLILPLIDFKTSKSVSDYLDNEQSIKQKLFG